MIKVLSAPMLSTPIVDLRGVGAKEPTFPDNGCEQSPSCLNCPLDFCKHDVSIDLQKRYARNIQVLDAFHDGLSTKELAKKFGIELKSVQRIIVSDPEDLLKTRLTCK